MALTEDSDIGRGLELAEEEAKEEKGKRWKIVAFISRASSCSPHTAPPTRAFSYLSYLLQGTRRNSMNTYDIRSHEIVIAILIPQTNTFLVYILLPISNFFRKCNLAKFTKDTKRAFFLDFSLSLIR